jgi:hypothetical protein
MQGFYHFPKVFRRVRPLVMVASSAGGHKIVNIVYVLNAMQSLGKEVTSLRNKVVNLHIFIFKDIAAIGAMFVVFFVNFFS